MDLLMGLTNAKLSMFFIHKYKVGIIKTILKGNIVVKGTKCT